LFGVYKITYGEEQLFNFIEIAFATQKITKLDDGLKGRYFVGAACATGKNPPSFDEAVCDFSKATPAQQQTSAYAKYKFLMG
jgi:hypothetical protein